MYMLFCVSTLFQLFELGLHQYTWRTEESSDFIESANALVCLDLHRSVDLIQAHCATIKDLAAAWSDCVLDVFSARTADQSYSTDALVQWQK